MPSSIRRALAAVALAAVGSLGLIVATSACTSPQHTDQVADVIVIPDAVPVPDAVYASGINSLGAYLATDTQTPAAATISVPGPDQVTGTIDPAGMDWLSRFAAGSETAGR